jgi:glycosyltransferase involved in cell wall biosynthesis
MLEQPISRASAMASVDRVDVDFSLAIHNRTGKYFIGRDLLDTEDLPVGDVYYWMLRARKPISGLLGRVVGRLQLHHIKGHALGGPMRRLQRRMPPRPLLHLDPFTVPSTVLRRGDAVLCHDLGPLTHPDLFDPLVCRIYKPIYDEIARVGPHLIFVSESSQQQFHAFYPDSAPASRRVIYNPTRAGVAGIPEPVPQVRQPFLLTVGSVGSRKNQLRCIQAFARSGLASSGVSYVICGPRDPGFDEVRATAAQTPGVILLPYVSDAQLTWLYRHAAGFVLMSLLEGFGMPVAEAIANGLVPLVTRDSVLEEVAGDGALVSSAEDAAEIAEMMVSLVRMSAIERRGRQKHLRVSIARFEIDAIRNEWRHAFRDILSSVSDG